SFFQLPGQVPTITFARPYRLARGEVAEASFPSEYVPLYPAFRERYRGYPENQQARLRFWRHPEGQSRGCVVAINGWCLGDRGMHSLMLSPGSYFSLGLDVVIYELPYHGLRNPSDRVPPFPGPDQALT